MKQIWINVVDFFTKNVFITSVLLFGILFLGMILNSRLKQEVAPQVEADAIHINIYHTTASAQEIEQDIIIPLEEIIQSFDISIRYTSFANDAYGRIMTSLPITKNLPFIRQRLIAALNNASNIPKDARIVITEEGAQSIPMYYFSLKLKEEFTNQIALLQKEAHIIDQQIKRLNNVYTTETSGLLRKEIFVNVNPNKLVQYYISLQEIIKSLLRRNINNSEGILDIDNSEKILITDAGFKYPLDITNTIIRSNFEQQIVSIHDVANIEEGFEKANNDVYINNTKAVFFGIRAKNDVDILQLTKQIDKIIENRKIELPKELELDIIEKRSDAISTIISLTQESAIIGIFIVFFILLLFLDWRTAFWTTISIPITLSLLLITLYYTNISMNIITLCGIITVLGMLVDHGIVISENIYRYREQGYSPMDAVKIGVSEVFSPIFVTVITTIAAFMPLLLIRDTIGNLIKPLPIVVSLALLFSFFDSVVFLPTHLAHIPIDKTHKTEKKWFLFIHKWYGIALKKSLNIRYLIILLFISILGGTVILMSQMFKGFVFLEPIGVGSVYVNLEAKAGISRQEMKSLVDEVIEIVKQTIPEHERTIIKEEIGRYHILSLSSRGFSPNRGQIAVYLSPIKERDREYDEILLSIQKAIENSPQATNFTRIFYDTFGLIPKTASALNMRFLQGIGSDSTNYISAMKEVFEHIQNLEGIINPEHSSLEGKNQIVLEFDFDKMAKLGIDARIVSDTLKIAISGMIPTTWRSYKEKIPYIVRLDPLYKNSIEELRELLIPNIFNKLIPLKSFTTITEEKGKEDILRSSSQRMVEIYIDIDPNVTTPTIINKQVEKFYNDIKYKYPDVDIQTGGESVSIFQAFDDFILAFLIASILIYIILLILFKEPLQPLIVLISIPFGIIGSIWAFYFHGQVLSFMSLVGVVGLSGVVVNDAVVMVDFINKVTTTSIDKTNFIDLVVKGSQNRLKAVLLTTITTIAGLLPSIYGLKGIADLIVPITTAIAYGLLFATLLTLFFIPVLYMMSYDIKIFSYNLFQKITLYKKKQI